MSDFARTLCPDRPWILALGVSLFLLVVASVGSGHFAVMSASTAAIGSLVILCARLAPLSLVALAGLWVACLCVMGLPAAGFAIVSALAPLLLATSALRQAERKSRQVSDQRARQSERKSRLVHDLRTPLNGISGAFEMLKRRDLDTRGEKYVTLGMASCADMAELLKTSEAEDPDGQSTARAGRRSDRHSQEAAENSVLLSGELHVERREDAVREASRKAGRSTPAVTDAPVH